jgi:plastocyanin
MMRLLLPVLIGLSATPALAGDLVVEVRGGNGKPVRDAVVSLYPGGRPAPLGGGARAFQIAQQNIHFSPFVLVVPVGSTVAFPNLDRVQHHVYSFSPTRTFELKLYAREQSRTVRFDKPGVVPIGCNIHDNMTAFVKVADTGFSARTDGNGRVRFEGVPSGMVVARIWHPWMRAPANQLETRWTIGGASQAEQVRIALRPPPLAASAY